MPQFVVYYKIENYDFLSFAIMYDKVHWCTILYNKNIL